MKVWLVCFLGLFGAVELYQWAASMLWLQPDLSLPVLGGGLVLAIGSNASRRKPLQQIPPPEAIVPSLPLQSPTQPELTAVPSPGLPVFDVNLKPRRSISFTVRKPLPPEDS